MDGIIQEPRELLSQASTVPAEGQELLGTVVEHLEDALKTLESLHLTLATALLDHAIAETKRHLIS